MPSDRVENALSSTIPVSGKWHGLQVTVSSLVVFEQRRIPVGVDFMDPPATYLLLGCGVQVGRSLGTHELRMGLRGTNLLNVRYRDYLDAFRYYADSRGLDVAAWVTYAFGGATAHVGDPAKGD
jgi:iron complex outermembrane receptor protein